MNPYEPFSMSFKENFKQQLRQSILMQLGLVNVAVYIFIRMLIMILQLFNIPGETVMSCIAMPAEWHTLLLRPWTIITYMLMHNGASHLFMNLLCLIWFGRYFLESFSQRQLITLYTIGGIVGGAFFALAYNVFPYFAPQLSTASLVGASGAITAIMVAAAVKQPNRPVGIFLLGQIKLAYVAGAMVLFSMMSILGSNAGGEFCHLGGALAGLLFALYLQHLEHKPKRPKKEDTRQENNQQYHYVKSDLGSETVETEDCDQDLDEILNKIKRSGYNSLTSEEKQQLFKSNK